MRRVGTALYGLTLLLASNAVGHAQFESILLDPKSYASPSGEVIVRVDPSSPTGGGPATYRCTRDGRELWAGTKPYTLWDAVVTDDGLVAGYAYGAGYEGGFDDSLTVVVLESNGNTRIGDQSRREGVLSCMGSGPSPTVQGLLLNTESDRLVVRIREDGKLGETWRVWSLSSGERLPDLDPSAGLPSTWQFGLGWARVLPEEPLTLAQWNWWDLETHRSGVRFALLDADAKVVWALEWPDERAPSEEERIDTFDGGILTAALGRFELRSLADERVTFSVERRSKTRWSVHELGREPLVDPPPAPPPLPLVALELPHSGSIALFAQRTPPVVRGIVDFGIDDQKRPGFVRATGRERHFVRVAADGQTAVEVALPGLSEESLALAWTERDRWVVTATSPAGGSRAWWIDAQQATASEIAGFEGPLVAALASTPRGGFVVVGSTRRSRYYWTDDLLAHDRTGRRVLALGGDQSSIATDWVSVLPDGELVVLDTMYKRLQRFSPTGEPHIDVPLDFARYPRNVHATRDGLLLVDQDDGFVYRVFRLDRSGARIGEIVPTHPDGSRLNGPFRVAPDGSLWASDGDCLYALDEGGATVRRFGALPDAARLESTQTLVLGPRGRIHAVDRRTGTVHVFDAEGTPLHRCVPAPDDFETSRRGWTLDVERDGSVVLDGIRFDADGTRIGRVDEQGRSSFGARYRQPRSELWWSMDSESLVLRRDEGQIVREVRRTPDDRWWRGANEACVAHDGSIALVVGPPWVYEPARVHVYAADGEPLHSWPMPEGWRSGWRTLAWDGTRVAASVSIDDRSAVALFDADGQPLGLVTPLRPADAWQPFFPPDKDELWLFDGERTIERYALR